ncbi:TPA: transcriptional regulator [Yersinia enterocolitica]|nr:transcriptional regulator [Yersinia enterocolitica]
MKNYTYIVNLWSIDLTSGFMTHQITQEQKRLGEYQLKLITVLLEHAGEVLSREKLTHFVWPNRVIGDNSLPNAIHTLRVALGDRNKQQRIIQTIPKMGYLIDPAFCKTIDERSEVEPDKPEYEQTVMTQVIAAEPDHHSRVSAPVSGETMLPTDIFNSKRLPASLLLVIMVIAGLGYWLL